jgi:hypothetical protein
MEGARQEDPFGPLLFALTLQAKLLDSAAVHDVTLAGPPDGHPLV